MLLQAFKPFGNLHTNFGVAEWISHIIHGHVSDPVACL